MRKQWCFCSVKPFLNHRERWGQCVIFFITDLSPCLKTPEAEMMENTPTTAEAQNVAFTINLYARYANITNEILTIEEIVFNH